MCEINFIYGLEEKLGTSELDKLISMLSESSVTNRDGFGIFNDKGIVVKSGQQFDLSIHATIVSKAMKDSAFVVSHSRAATCGAVNLMNAHPFKVNSFLFCHNGILTNEDVLRKKFNINDKVKTDSVVIGHIIHHYYKSGKTLVSAIASATKHLSGFHSVFLYDTRQKKLYYLKHNASFMFRLISIKGKYSIIGSTNTNNIKNIIYDTLYGFPIRADVISSFEPDDDILYEISTEGIKPVKPLKFPAFVSAYTPSNGIVWSGYDEDGRPYKNNVAEYNETDGIFYQTDQTTQTTKSTNASVNRRTEIALNIITQHYPSLTYQTIGKMKRFENASDLIKRYINLFKKITYVENDPSNIIGFIKDRNIRKIAKRLSTKQGVKCG